VVVHSPQTPAAEVQLPDVALLIMTPANHPFRVCVMCSRLTSKQFAIVEEYKGDCRRCDAPATYLVYHPSQNLQALGY